MSDGGSWRFVRPARQSLEEVYATIHIPSGGWWRRMLAFAGPGFLIAVGYMDPGNWATDIAGGAAFNYRLLSVILISNFVAVFLQAMAARLGLVTGRDLAQACRETYSRPVSIFLWLWAEVGIVACDVAEVLGAAIALLLLFHIPLLAGVVLTGLDVLIVLALQNRGFRIIEAIVISLIAIIVALFAVELYFARPEWAAVLQGFIPRGELVTNPTMLYIGLGIVGATVMPHNLYLHSSIVQTRKIGPTDSDLRSAIRFALTDSAIALTVALCVNAAILIVAAAAFFRSGHHEIADIQGAYRMITPVLGAALAAPIFGIALLASGQDSTITGTLAGQVVLEGFMQLRIPPWQRRLISRGLAIVPAVLVIAWAGPNATGGLMIFSQVILSAALIFAVVPLVSITADRKRMGDFVNRRSVTISGWILAAALAVTNIWLAVATLLPMFHH